MKNKTLTVEVVQVISENSTVKVLGPFEVEVVKKPEVEAAELAYLNWCKRTRTVHIQPDSSAFELNRPFVLLSNVNGLLAKYNYRTNRLVRMPLQNSKRPM